MISLAEEGITMICVTHEIGFARQVADRVIFMASDEIIEEEPPAEVFVAPLHERTRIFLGDIAPRHESKLRRFAIDAYPTRLRILGAGNAAATPYKAGYLALQRYTNRLSRL